MLFLFIIVKNLAVCPICFHIFYLCFESSFFYFILFAIFMSSSMFLTYIPSNFIGFLYSIIFCILSPFSTNFIDYFSFSTFIFSFFFFFFFLFSFFISLKSLSIFLFYPIFINSVFP